MTIQITKPEVEAMIRMRMQSGGYVDVEDVILQALQSSPPSTSATIRPIGDGKRTLRDVFESVRGLADDVDFERNPSQGRSVEIA